MLDEVLQQVAVVAGQLDHQAVGTEVPVPDQSLGVASREWASSASENDEKYG